MNNNLILSGDDSWVVFVAKRLRSLCLPSQDVQASSFRASPSLWKKSAQQEIRVLGRGRALIRSYFPELFLRGVIFMTRSYTIP